MQMMLNLALLIVGFVLLIKGADVFVDGAVGISRTLKIPAVVVGLTIVAFGTSAPEAAVSIAAATVGNNGIAAGNIIGSNMFNLLMVTGISAIFMVLPVSKSIIKTDYPFMMAVTFALFFMLLEPSATLSRGDGLILLLFLVIFLVYTVRGALNSRDAAEEAPSGERSLVKSVLFLLVSLVAIVLGGDMVVKNASAIALSLGMSNTLVGLTIVALGTSLPELVTSIVASRKGENEIAIGNVVGSNVFNIGLVLGLSSAINPIAVGRDIVIDTALLLLISLVIAVPMFKNKKMGRALGAFMVAAYGAYLAYILMRNYGLI